MATALVLFLMWKFGPGVTVTQRPVDAAVVPSDLAEPMMSWRIESTPAGAAVYDPASKSLLGHTPWAKLVPAGTEPLKVELQLAGYRPASVTLEDAQRAPQMITLLPLPRHWQVSSEPAGALVVDPDTGEELGRTPWTFTPEPEDRRMRRLRIEAPRRVPVELSLDPQRDEDKRVTLHAVVVSPPQPQKLTVLCVESTSLAARSAAVYALRQAGYTTLRPGESIVIKRDGHSLAIAESHVAGLDEVKQRIVESALREILRGQSLPDQLTVKCGR